MKRLSTLTLVSIIAVAIAFLVASCGTTGANDRFRYTVEPVHSEQEFLATVKALADQEGWGDYEIHKSGVQFDGGRWSALVEFLPYSPGGHMTVFISPDGDVRIIPGA